MTNGHMDSILVSIGDVLLRLGVMLLALVFLADHLVKLASVDLLAYNSELHLLYARKSTDVMLFVLTTTVLWAIACLLVRWRITSNMGLRAYKRWRPGIALNTVWQRLFSAIGFGVVLIVFLLALAPMVRWWFGAVSMVLYQTTKAEQSEVWMFIEELQGGVVTFASGSLILGLLLLFGARLLARR